MNMYPEFIDFLGEVRNDTGVNGKAFVFKMIEENHSFECILFVHPTVDSFVTIDDTEVNVEPDRVLNCILNKYSREELLSHENQ
jgi:hypothetical protein